jgi:hypothetical protein
MTLQENIQKIRKMMNLKEEDEMMDNTVELKGKILDLSDLSDEQKQEFKLKEKVIVDKKDNEYPIVLVQLANGKVIVFDVDGSIKDSEEEPLL